MFGGIFVQKVFETNLNFMYQGEKKIWQNKCTLIMSILKADNKISAFILNDFLLFGT